MRLATCMFVLRGAAVAAMLVALGSSDHMAIGQEAADEEPIYLDEPLAPPAPVVVSSGKVPEKYEDGTIRIEREVLKMSDDQLVNHGTFTEFYPDGKKFAEGTYENGVHNGTWSFWHKNGQLCKTVTFDQGRANGAWQVFRDDGTLLAEKTYKNNLREGLWKAYFDDGTTLRVEETFVNGLREGVSRAYFSNGRPQREVYFKAGQLEGLTTEWDESGRKIGEVNFKEGKRHGRFVIYRADGTEMEQTYEMGRLISNN
jgi:antitoxin component YwqK of YwqJK toxin-antitoxin module